MKCPAGVCLLLLSTVVFAQAPKPPITYAAAEEALKRAPKVPAGLTVAQVWDRLGLSKFAKPQLGRASGPQTGYIANYELTDIHRITLTIDYSLKPPRVKKIEGSHVRT